MTLTKMLAHSLDYYRAESQLEQETNLIQLLVIKSTFKKWLFNAELPSYFTLGRDGRGVNATEETVRLLITLVDES